MVSVSVHSLRKVFLVPMATIGVAAVPALAGPPSVHLRVVALTGQHAPGTSAGTLFSFFAAADFDGAPAIGADSTIGLAGLLSDGTAGFWLDHGSGPELLALSGTHAPGTEAGVVFSQRQSETFIFTPPLLVPGHAVFRDAVTGPGVGFTNDDGIWRSTSAGVSLVAREGAPAPGLQGVRLGALNLHALDNAGRAILSTLLVGAVVDQNNESIWRAAPGADLELLAREGDAAPGAGLGVVFANPVSPSTFPIIVGNTAGDVIFQGNLHGPGTGSGNDEALFIRDAAGTRLFIREGDPVPGMPGFVFRSGATAGFNTSDIAFNDHAHVAIVARVQSATGTANALFSDAGGTLTLIARTGDPAPGTDERFGFLTSPVMNNHGDIAFISTVGPGANPGLWLYSGGVLRAVALPDQPVPGLADGDRYFSVQTIHGFNDDGFVLFNAVILSPVSAALVLAGPSGDPAILARIQSNITIGEGDSRRVSQVVARRGALSDNAHAAIEVQFTDGSSAHIDASIGDPTPPCTADINRDGVLSSQDFFSFLALFFAGEPAADFDASGAVNSQDLFSFITAFFAGC